MFHSSLKSIGLISSLGSFGSLGLFGLLIFLTFGSAVPILAQLPSPAANRASEKLLLTSDKVVYQSTDEFTFTLDAEGKPWSPGATPSPRYTFFIYIQQQDTGQRWYYSNFQDGVGSDMLGATSGYGTYEVPTVSAFQMLGPDGWNGNRAESLISNFASMPGRYTLVLELRDSEGASVMYSTRTAFNVVSEVETISGEITSDTTWNNDKAYLLSGAVFVRSGATLTIEHGTVVLGESATDGTLIIDQGAKINAKGTWGSPIIMTSDQEVGDRARADWGGLIINGRAPVNTPGGTSIGEGDTGTYGGTDPEDSSGTLSYVRVEFAGTEFSPDNELNGIAFQGVGSGTTVDHVQVHFNQDDGVEFFGGTVDVKHVLITNIRDDSFDWTEGWTGRGQFLVAQQNGEAADNGFEGDNNAENNTLTPRSAPMLYNFTLFGDPDELEGTESDDGMLIREGSAGTYQNFIVMGFNVRGLNVDHDATIAEAQAGNLSFDNAIFFENGETCDTDASPFVTDKNIDVIDPDFLDPYDLMFPDFRPADGSPALDANRVQSPPDDGFFDTSVDYLGGVDPRNDWTRGWTTSHLN